MVSERSLNFPGKKCLRGMLPLHFQPDSLFRNEISFMILCPPDACFNYAKSLPAIRLPDRRKAVPVFSLPFCCNCTVSSQLRFLFLECSKLPLHFLYIFLDAGLIQLCKHVFIIPVSVLCYTAEQRCHILCLYRFQSRCFRRK